MSKSLIFKPVLEEEQVLATRLLGTAVEQSRLANAYLLVGDNREAKLDLAKQVAAYLNCSSTERDTRGSCFRNLSEVTGFCQNCRWISEGKHPQAWLELMPREGASTKIPVEQARLLSEEFTKTSGYKRVAVIYEASQDVFHRPSANALLKTIEEPRGNGVFFLFARSEDNVLRTIVSRCQVVPVIMPGKRLVGPLNRLLDRSAYSSGLANLFSELKEDESELVGVLKELSTLPFFEWSRNLARGGAKKACAHPTTGVEALEFVESSLGIIGQGDNVELLVDVVYLTELEIIGTMAIDSPILTDYLNELLRLCEETKWRISKYVGKKSVFESFAFQWIELRQSLSYSVSG
ncbi:MAG TPA: hypothetical protein PKD05_01595 [Candidatus Melainabacteria bacterium]|nr:hypothetical protein [Candidatus Melainabacteria bacterium]